MIPVFEITHPAGVYKDWETAVGDDQMLRIIQFILVYLAREDPLCIGVYHEDDIVVIWEDMLNEPILRITRGVFGLSLFDEDGDIHGVMHTNDLDRVFFDSDFGLLWRLPLRA